MDKKSKVLYWIESSEDDWRVASHLFEKGDYSYSLFFGHLTIEKMLKALYVDRREKKSTLYPQPHLPGSTGITEFVGRTIRDARDDY